MSEPPPDEAARPREPASDPSQKVTTVGKKKRTRGASEPAMAAVGSEPPASAPSTEDADRLREANAAFEAGNYALVHTLARALEQSKDPAVVDAARDLARRTSVDPLQIAFLSVCMVALLTIAYLYILR